MLDVLDEYLKRGEGEREARDRDGEDDPERDGEEQSLEPDRLTEQSEHDQDHDVADELQHERGGDGGVDDELVREGNLANEP